MATTLSTSPPRSAPSTKGKRQKQKNAKGTRRFALLLLSPTFIVLALVVGYPILAGIRESLYSPAKGLDADGFVIQGEHFSGLDNYTSLFQGDRGDAFWNAFYNTTFFTVVAVVIETVLGVLLALIMARAFKGRALIRASILVPWAIPTAMSGLLWKWIFQPNGVANAMLHQEILWGTDGAQAKFAILIAEVWKTSPFIGLLVLAGLQIIPKEVYEAARVDGATAWQQFWRITLPLVKPALVVAVLFRMLDTLRMFDLPFVLIGSGHPSVETITMLAYSEANRLHYGVANAYGTLLFLYIALIAYTFVKVLGADVIGPNRQARKEKAAKQ